MEQKLQHTAGQLSTLCGTVVTSAPRAAALTRSAHSAAGAAAQLAQAAGAVAARCPAAARRRRLEAAAQDMSFATYRLLKAAEQVSRQNGDAGARRRMLDACRALNDSIHTLVSVYSSRTDVQLTMHEITINLRLGLRIKL